MRYDQRIPIELVELNTQLQKAVTKHITPIRSYHEAIGVILEEWDEVKVEAFMQTVDRFALRKELYHLAAMAIRSIIDLDL